MGARIGDLDPGAADRVRAQRPTYPEVGRVLVDRPAGYRHLARKHVVHSTRSFDALAEDVLTWQVQARAGLRVATSSRRLEVGTVVVLRLGPLRIPCRVVTVLDERDRRGFAYGTLPGHPERGEEAFVLTRDAEGTVTFTITAFSRPATLLARLGGPVSTAVQDLMTRRYLRALDD